MDTTSIIILGVLVIILLLLIEYSDQIENFMESKLLYPATRHAQAVQLLLSTLLGVILTELWRAMTTLDWFRILMFGLFVILIILAIWDIQKRSEYRQRWLDLQSTKSLTASITKSLKTSIKDAVKQALAEDRAEAKKKK